MNETFGTDGLNMVFKTRDLVYQRVYWLVTRNHSNGSINNPHIFMTYRWFSKLGGCLRKLGSMVRFNGLQPTYKWSILGFQLIS